MPRPKIQFATGSVGGGGNGQQASGQSANNSGDGEGPSEWTKSGSFIHKPLRGWLHPDQQISDSGICYGVRYIGCLEVNTSMKSLDFDTRSQIAKECINRVCEAAGLKTVDKKRKVDKRISRMLADKPNMDFAGSNVNLTIASSYLNLAVMESGEVIANHDMPNISFASGGDADTLDFVAYVAKDHQYGRACFILECGGGLAQDVITTIGQAFELRFKEFLRRAPRAISVPDRLENPVFNGASSAWGEDPEYYNDLPGKIPPEAPPPVPPLPDYHSSHNGTEAKMVVYASTRESTSSQSITTTLGPLHNVEAPQRDKDTTGNLIDLGMEVPPLVTQRLERPQPESEPFESTLPSPQSPVPPPPPRHRTPTPTLVSSSHRASSPSPPLLSPPPSSSKTPQTVAKAGNTALHRTALLQEEWFHGPISRKDSESLVLRDGDFLVRESQGSPGQYVLTGMQGGLRKHLLLVDPEGVVRTKDRTFESVSHLITYHRDNGLPIISAESALILRTQIVRSRPVR